MKEKIIYLKMSTEKPIRNRLLEDLAIDGKEYMRKKF